MNEHNITCFCVDCEHNKNENCELKSISLDYVEEKRMYGKKYQAACNSYTPREESEDE